MRASLRPLAGGIYSATLADGSALPSWLTIDRATGVITANVPLALLANIGIVLTVSDGTTAQSASFTESFNGNQGAIVRYTPPTTGNGTPAQSDRFTYTLNDEREGSVTGIVNVTLNAGPQAVSDRIDAVEDTALTIDVSALLANDTDADGDLLTITAIGQAANGSVIWNGNTILYVPNQDFSGLDQFSYTISDGRGGVSTTTVTLDVARTNVAPVAGTDRLNGTEDTAIFIDPVQILSNDTDANGDVLTFVRLNAPVSGGARVFVMPDGRWQITPDADLHGPITLTYEVTDGTLTSFGTIEIDIAPVNDAPTLRADATYVMDEDAVLTITMADILANDMDPEGDTFQVISVYDPDNGTVSLVGGQAIFTPRADYFGNAGFRYIVADAHGAQTEGYVNITVRPMAEIPVAIADRGFTVAEDGELVLDPAILMANDYDPDEHGLTFLGFRSGPVTQRPDGAWVFTPPSNQYGPFTLTYAVTNATGVEVTANVTVDVTPTPDAPMAVDDQLQAMEDQALVVSASALTGNDQDVDGDLLSIASVSNPVGVTVDIGTDGKLTIRSLPDFWGTGGFDYTVTDPTGLSSTAHVVVEITPVDDAPIAGADQITLTEDTPTTISAATLLSNDHDPEQTPLSVTGISNASGLAVTLNPDGTLTLVPNADFAGSGGFDYTVTDATGQSATGHVTVTVNPVDDGPRLAAPLPDRLADEDTAFSIALQTSLFSDPDGDPLSFALSLGDGSALPGWITFDPVTQTISGTPPLNFTGSIMLRLTASDGATAIYDDFQLRFMPSDDTPVLVAPLRDRALDDSNKAIVIGTAFVLSAEVAAFRDPDQDALTFTARLANGNPLPSWLTFDGLKFSGTAPVTAVGSLAIELIATDGRSSASDVFNLTIGGTINGTNASETLSGTASNDTLFGLGGDDVIFGGDGNDTIQGGAGNDTIQGGAGDDNLTGETGNDIYQYTSGDDVISTGVQPKINSGLDTLDLRQYTSDQVRFKVNSYNVDVATPAGVVTLFYQTRGNLGGDVAVEQILFSDVTLNEAAIRARALSDQSTSGNDTIHGTAFSADVVVDGGGNDAVYLYGGDDTYVYASGNDVLATGVQAKVNSGFDTLDLRKYTADQVRFKVVGYNIEVTTPDGVITLYYQVRNDLGGDVPVEQILLAGATLDAAAIRTRALNDQATSWADTITGTAFSPDLIDGLAGNDVINGLGGNEHDLWRRRQ